MDESDFQNIISLKESLEEERRMVTVAFGAELAPEKTEKTATTIKSIYHGRVVTIVEPPKKVVTPEQKAQLDAAWQARVETYRQLKDCKTPAEVMVAKKKYFQSIGVSASSSL